MKPATAPTFGVRPEASPPSADPTREPATIPTGPSGGDRRRPPSDPTHEAATGPDLRVRPEATAVVRPRGPGYSQTWVKMPVMVPVAVASDSDPRILRSVPGKATAKSSPPNSGGRPGMLSWEP